MLVRYGPVFAAGDTPDSPPNEHVFTIVGYDDHAQAFTVLNSFGDQWGTNGMMKMPYGSVINQPADQTTPRVDWVRWVNNQASSQLEPYTARIRVDHIIARNNLVIRVGVDGQAPVTVWNRPNRTRVIDTSKGLTFDFPLPDYASKHWPPNDKNRWYVEVQDASGRPASETVATVREVTLVQRRLGAPPVLYRPSQRTFLVAGGGTTRMNVPAKSDQAKLSDRLDTATTDGNVGPAGASAAGKGPSVRKKKGAAPDQGATNCYTFDPSSTIVSEFKNGWAVLDSTKPGRAIVSFRNERRDDAEMALQAIRKYGMNQVCPTPGLTLYLVSGRPAQGNFQGERCIQFDPANLRVEARPRKAKESGEVLGTVWEIKNGPNQFLGFGDNEADARAALATIRTHGFTNSCFAGFSYLRR